MTRNLIRSILVGALLLLSLGLLGGIALHVELNLTWGRLVFPIFAFVAVQIASLGGMLWVRKRGSARGGFSIAGLYCLASGLLVIHYGSRWGLLRNIHASDLWLFALLMLIVTIVGAIFMPGSKTETRESEDNN